MCLYFHYITSALTSQQACIMNEESGQYKFPIHLDRSARLVPGIFFTSVGIFLLALNLSGVLSDMPIHFGGFISIVGVLIFGVKRDITIDLKSGTITSNKGFFFLANKSMYHKREFEEVYLRRIRTKRISDSASGRDSVSYNLVLDGRNLVTVDVFSDKKEAEQWQQKLAEALQLKVGEERAEIGVLGRPSK